MEDELSNLGLALKRMFKLIDFEIWINNILATLSPTLSTFPPENRFSMFFGATLDK